ncbi:MAG: hypothetical protein AB7E61_06105 [Acholeplasmataceae bacterium]
MQENQKIEEKKETTFIELKDLTSADVKKLPRFTASLTRSENRAGLSTQIRLVIDKLNLQINLVSTERTSTYSRQLRYFLPDAFIALIMALGLPQVDEDGKPKNSWIYTPVVRFVKGKFANSDEEYFSIEVIFKQYKYHVHFLTKLQKDILDDLIKSNELKDYQGNPVKVKWLERPTTIEKMEDIDVDFTF